MTLNTLNPEDIDEKIRLNENDGIDIFTLKEMITEELKCCQWIVIRNQVQSQCYVEQLQHINKRIEQLELAK